jgi:hypothetical protein
MSSFRRYRPTVSFGQFASSSSRALKKNERAIGPLKDPDENVLPQSQGFTSLWERDYAPGNLSQRRQNAVFGWVNKTMRHEWSLAAHIFTPKIGNSRSLSFHLTDADSPNWWIILRVLRRFPIRAKVLKSKPLESPRNTPVPSGYCTTISR